MYTTTTDMSCGVSLLEQIREGRNPRDILISLIQEHKNIGVNDAFYVFSDKLLPAHRNCSGKKLYKFIKDNPILGTCEASSIRINPNTGNRIQIWIWVLPSCQRNSDTRGRDIWTKALMKHFKITQEEIDEEDSTYDW